MHCTSYVNPELFPYRNNIPIYLVLQNFLIRLLTLFEFPSSSPRSLTYLCHDLNFHGILQDKDAM